MTLLIKEIFYSLQERSTMWSALNLRAIVWLQPPLSVLPIQILQMGGYYPLEIAAHLATYLPEQSFGQEESPRTTKRRAHCILFLSAITGNRNQWDTPTAARVGLH